VRSKADISQLNVPHGTIAKAKKWEEKNTKMLKKTRLSFYITVFAYAANADSS